jgi:hypothetical protein
VPLGETRVIVDLPEHGLADIAGVHAPRRFLKFGNGARLKVR